MSASNGDGTANSALDVMEIHDGDTVHTVRFGDFNALDSRAFRIELDMSLWDAFALALSGRNELDVLAGLVWLHLRKTQPDLTFTEVAERFTVDHVMTSLGKQKAAGAVAAEGVDGENDPSSRGVGS